MTESNKIINAILNYFWTQNTTFRPKRAKLKLLLINLAHDHDLFLILISKSTFWLGQIQPLAWQFNNINFIQGHSQKRWSFDSMSFIHKGHAGSIIKPRLTKTPRTGSALWSSCHKKILIFGIISSCQIHWKDQAASLESKLLWAAHVAERVVKEPEPVSPQQKVSFVSKMGIRISKFFWIIGLLFNTVWSLGRSQILSLVIKLLTVESIELSWPRISTRLELSTQLSHQKLMFSLVPTVHLKSFLSNDRLRNTLFQTGESLIF